MNETKTVKNQTNGSFELVGFATILDDTFKKNLVGKNNANWIYSRLNMKLEDITNDKTMYINIQDGFDKVKGKTIYANDKDNQQLKINFADRTNPELLKLVNDYSFASIGIIPKEKEKEITYINYLTIYDVIEHLSKILQIGQRFKVKLKGKTKYSLYNGKINKEFDLKKVYILPEDDETPCHFKFEQNFLINKESLVMDKFEEEGEATINAKLYQTKKNKITEEKEAFTLDIPMVLRSTPENKESVKKLIDTFFTITDDTVRKMNMEGTFNVGYVGGNVTEEDIPAELQQMIDLGCYTLEDVMKKLNKKNQVDELQLLRPVIISDEDGIRIDKDDTTYTKEDLEDAKSLNDLEAEQNGIVGETVHKEENVDLGFLNGL